MQAWLACVGMFSRWRATWSSFVILSGVGHPSKVGWLWIGHAYWVRLWSSLAAKDGSPPSGCGAAEGWIRDASLELAFNGWGVRPACDIDPLAYYTYVLLARFYVADVLDPLVSWWAALHSLVPSAWKVECTCVSEASDVAVVMIFVLCLCGSRWADNGGSWSSAMAAPWSCYGGLTRGYQAVRDLGSGAKVFLGKSSAFRCQRRQYMWVS
jgi:hypothetical protein